MNSQIKKTIEDFTIKLNELAYKINKASKFKISFKDVVLYGIKRVFI